MEHHHIRKEPTVMTAPTAILPALTAFFDGEDWPYTLVEDDALLRLAFQGESGQWLCYARVYAERDQCAFYSLCPVRAAPERMAAVAEALARANYGLIIGNFELDYDDGEIRYKTSLDSGGAPIAEGQIRSTVYANVATMDRYLPAILAVLYGEAEPRSAVAAVEAPAQAPLQVVAHLVPQDYA
jgi:hypothetical protein